MCSGKMEFGMKYVIVLADGMADEPLQQLGDKTPMEVANTPTMDQLAKYGQVGLVSTVPKGMKPGSDVANLAVRSFATSVAELFRCNDLNRRNENVNSRFLINYTPT